MESVKDISRDAWGGDSEPLRAEFEDESLRWSRDDEEPERSEPCRDADASGVIRCSLTSDGGCASEALSRSSETGVALRIICVIRSWVRRAGQSRRAGAYR